MVVRVFGDKYDVLGSTAADVKKAIAGIEGIAEAKVKTPIQEAALETEVDLVAAQQHGLKPGDVRRAAACLLSGIQVGALYEDQKVFDVVVWSTPETRHSLSSIGDLMIDAPGGKRVRLGDVAKVRIVPSASVIRHDGVKRYVDVVADVKGRDLAAVAGDINNQLKGLKLPARILRPSPGRLRGAASGEEPLYPHHVCGGCRRLLPAAVGIWKLAFGRDFVPDDSRPRSLAACWRPLPRAAPSSRSVRWPACWPSLALPSAAASR